MKQHLKTMLAVSVLLVAGCTRSAPEAGDHHMQDDHGHATGAPAAEPAARGSHGGRLLEAEGYRVELAIAEQTGPPQYQAWLYRGDKPLPATAGTVEVNLVRLGNVPEQHQLVAQPDGSLKAATIVGEPHSFDVEVRATVDGHALRWTYPSYEGRTRIAAEIAETAGIQVAPAAAGVIADEHVVQGLLTPMEGAIAQVAARFPGPIRSLAANVGDRVRAGQVLAVVESNLSLSNYEITAPISGTVLARHAVLGANAAEAMTLYEIADLSRLWVDLHLFGSDAQHIVAGVPVEVTRLTDGVHAPTRLERVLPGTATASQSTVARAIIDNADGRWRPGSAVTARITVEQLPAQLVVPLSALQKFRDWDVVFIRVGDTYEVRPLELGNRDARNVEVLEGLEPGDAVVVHQSYLVKADIEKSGATHDH